MFEKIKQLSKDTAVYGISTMVGRLLNFILVPFYTHVFLPAEYGIIINIYAFIGILIIIYQYGMDSAYMKYDAVKTETKSDNFSTAYFSVIVVSILLSMLILVFKLLISGLMGVPANLSHLIYYVAAILFLDAAGIIPFISLRLERKAKKFAAFKIINISTNAALNLILILHFKMGIEAVFLSNIVASSVSLLLLMPTIFNNLKLNYDFSILKKLLKFGLPYLPAGLAAMLIQVIDVPILKSLTDYATVGIYKANYKLGIFMMLFVTMFQFAWQPFFLQNAAEKNAKELFSIVFTYFTITGSFILIILSLFIDDFVKIEIFGRSIIEPSYWSGLSIVPIILLGYLFNGFYVIFTAGIYIEEKSIYAPFITGAGAILNIAANFLLIPILGMIGAALATVLSYLVMAAGLYFVTQKFYRIEYELKKIFKKFLIIFLVGSVYYYLLFNNELLFIYKIFLLIFFIAAMFIFIIDKKEKDFLKSIRRRRSKM